MKNGIPSEKYYFLLEWKDENLEAFMEIYGKRGLNDLTPFELNKLYEVIQSKENNQDPHTNPTNYNSENNRIPTDWFGLDCIPPDEEVEVIDEAGNKGVASPTWYSWKVEPNPKKIGKWTSDVVHCEPYWDGGWLIEAQDFSNKIGTIVAWKPILR